MSEQIDNKQLTGYLLGGLPEDETERLDELSVSSDDFARQLRSAELDLVDAYARGDLSGTELERFESHYLASPMRRERVRFARALSLAAEKAEGSPVVERREHSSQPARKQRVQQSVGAWRRFAASARLAPVFATAALLLLVVSGYLVLEETRLRDRIAQTEAERAALLAREQELAQQLDDHRTRDASNAEELARVRERLAELEHQGASPGPGNGPGRDGTTSPSPDKSIVAFVLAPPVRGAGGLPELSLPRGAKTVDVKLELEASDFPAYQVALIDPSSNQALWQSSRLVAVSRGAGRVISIHLPASLLKPQNYFLQVTGLSADAASEVISSYPFKVAIK